MLRVNRPAREQTFVYKCLGTDNVCMFSRPFCLSLHTSISICMSLNAVCMLYTCPVSHERVTVSQPWLILMTEPVSPCHTPRAYYKEHTGVCVCSCVFVRPGLGAYSPTCHCGKVLVGLISAFRVCPVQVKTVDPSVWGRMSKAYRDRLGWCTETGAESTLAGERLWGEARLSVKTLLTLSRQKVQLIAHNLGIQERKQPACSTCALSEMKRKNKSVLTSCTATRSK